MRETVRPITTGSNAAKLAAIGGGILGAIGASACCILPLALFSLGISGAWIANLTALAPYHGVFVGVSVSALAAGYYLTYRATAGDCAEEAACSHPLPGKIIRYSLWLATILIGVAAVFPYIAPWLVGEQG